MDSERGTNKRLMKETEVKMRAVSADLRAMADVFDDIADGRMPMYEGMSALGYAPSKQSASPGMLSLVQKNPLSRLMAKAFSNNELEPEDIRREWLNSEPGAMRLVREIFNIPDDKLIDSEGFDSIAIWEFAKRHLNEREFSVIKQRFCSTIPNDNKTVPFGNIEIQARDRAGTVSSYRVHELYNKAIRRLVRASRLSRERETLIRAIFGIDPEILALQVYCVADFLLHVKDPTRR